MYPPHHAGGYELVWEAAMAHARVQGHVVRILTSDHRAAPDHGEREPDVHRTLRWYWDPGTQRFVGQGRLARVRLERHNAAELRRHLDEFRPDVVAWWSMGCMSLSLIEQVRRAGIPGVFVVHDDWLSYGWRNDAWSRTWKHRRGAAGRVATRLCGLPTQVDIDAAGPLVFNSSYTLEHARRAGVDVSAATVVRPGIHERFLTPAPPNSWHWRLAYVGRIDRRKGIDTAVASLAHLPSAATLAIHGSGDEAYAAELRALARRLGAEDRVRFAGFAAGDALPGIYAAADAVVFPVRWEEPFGLVPLEAMGVGRPVVATSRGGATEFLADGENALVFRPDDAGALAACVERLAGDEALRAHLISGGLRTAAAHTVERFAERTMTEIVRAAQRRPR